MMMRFASGVLIALAVCVVALEGSPASSPLHHDTAAVTPPQQLTSCAAVKPIFITKNISTEIPETPVTGSRGLSLCPVSAEGEGSCCTADMEDRLRSLVRHDLQSVIRHSALSVQGVLENNAAQYSELLLELSHRSENHTQDLFLRVYEKLAPQARAPIITLYSEIRRALTDSSTTASLNDSSSELEEAVNTFFSQLFPLVYRHSVTHAPGELSEDYAVCLQATMPEVRPYGETPRALATAVSRSIRATRVLLRALKLGIETLDTTERVWERGEECSVALLRMSYCARCAGLPTVKPCAGYCLNVLRGCLAHLAELDASWNGFVDGVERLVLAARSPTALLNVETVIRTMDTRVSEAIMHAMENGPALERRVKAACGPAQWVVDSAPPATNNGSAVSSTWSPPSPAVDVTEEPRITSLLHGVIASLARSKRFYAGLADTLCSDDSYAETAEDADCWNGHRVAQYTKTVVGAGVGAQKYNPELAWGSRHQPDSRIAQLSDRLRHTRQLLLGQLSTSLEADSLLMDQGSGSGYGTGRGGSWTSTDDEDVTEDWEGSGSGDHSISPDKSSNGGSRTNEGTNPKETSGGTGRNNAATTPTSSGPKNHVISWTSLLSTLLLVLLLQCRA